MIWLFLVPIVLLLVGLADLPTGYYVFLRIVVCIVCAISCYGSYKTDDKIGFATIVFALLAILFNPIIPIYLHEKEVWSVIDVVTAVILGVRYFTFRANEKNK